MAPGDDRLQKQSDENRINLLRTELRSILTFANLAQTELGMREREAAERLLGEAEKAYATVVRFLSDPKHASHIPAGVLAEFNGDLQRRRHTLDELRRRIDEYH